MDERQAIALENLERLHRREGHDEESHGFCVVCDQEWPCEVMVAVGMARKYEGLLT